MCEAVCGQGIIGNGCHFEVVSFPCLSMLRNFVLVSSSGIVLFEKEFYRGIPQPRMIGSLMTAIKSFSTQCTGLPAAYIELTNIAITIASAEDANIMCALFHDVDDGQEFSRIIGSEIVRAFVEEYGAYDSNSYQLKDLKGFHVKIPEIIRNSVRPIIHKLRQKRGVHNALVVTDDQQVFSITQVDELGVVANLQALLSGATDLMNVQADTNESIIMEGVKKRTIIYRVEHATFVVTVSKSVDFQQCIRVVDNASKLLRKVYLLLANLQDYRYLGFHS